MKCLFLIGLLLLCGSSLFSQEIPNGDGDLIWEQDIWPRFVIDAKFHPITGNIIAAVNHEIWEIDPKDGHKIRVFEGTNPEATTHTFSTLQITNDGKTVISGPGGGLEGLIIWDYDSGKVRKRFDKGGPHMKTLGIYPDDKRVVFFTFQLADESQQRFLVIYNFENDSIIKKVNISPKGTQNMTLSKDGKYLAIAFRYKNSSGVWDLLMELWDAETLTHIRDFGEAVSANEFWDVKISNDNQYVGFRANNKFYLYKQNGEIENVNSIIDAEYFQFTPDSRFILLGGQNKEGNYIALIKELNSIKIPYHYTLPRGIFLFNEKNELFSHGMYNKLFYFTNRWFTVDVKDNQIDSTFKINYAEKKLFIENSTNQILKSLEITDINGKILHTINLDFDTNLKLKFDITFIPGVYFATIHTEYGKIYSQKFIVLE